MPNESQAGKYALRVRMQVRGEVFCEPGTVVDLSHEDAERGLAQGTIVKVDPEPAVETVPVDPAPVTDVQPVQPATVATPSASNQKSRK